MATGNRRRRLLRRKQKARELRRLCAMYQRLLEVEAQNEHLEQLQSALEAIAMLPTQSDASLKAFERVDQYLEKLYV